MDVTCRLILEAMPGRFLPEGAGDWNALIQFKFKGPKGGDWTVTVKDKTCKVAEGVAEKPTATVETTDEVWINMCLGKLDPTTAFMTGQILVTGNMADIMKINSPKVFRRELMPAK